MRDETSLNRQWILYRTLASRHHGLTIRELAADLDVNEKTIRRDLDRFRRLGFPLEETVGEYGRKTWRLNGANQVPLSFTHEEAAALWLGRRLLDPLAGTVFWVASQRAFQKIRAGFGTRIVAYLDRFAPLFHSTALGATDYEPKAELIDALLRACEESKATHILYQSEHATEPAYRDVYPYGLILNRAWLYLIAFDPNDDRIKHYKVDRIDEVEVSPMPFRRPEGFSLRAHLAETFGIYHSEGEPVTVKVRFAPAVARYVQETKWPGCSKLTKQRDGSVLGEFRLGDTHELKSWLLSFGAKAVVLEPEALRQEIVEELESLCMTYNDIRDQATRAEPKRDGSRSRPPARRSDR